MAKIVVELYGPGPVPRAYCLVNVFPVRIGRGYDNDVILYDPHVCARHVVLTEDEEGWLLEDISAHNGVEINGVKSVSKSVRIRSGDEVVVGQTRLRFVAPDHPVSSALRLATASKALEWLKRPWALLALTAALMAIEAFDKYIKTFEDQDFSRYLLRISILPVLVVAWGSGWAFVGQLLRHRPQFRAQYNLTAVLVILAYLGTAFSNYLGYLLSSNMVESVTRSILGVGQIVLLLYGNLSFATRLSFKKKLVPAILIAVAVHTLALFSNLSRQGDFRSAPDFCNCLKPTVLNPDARTTAAQFMKKNEQVFADLEEELKKAKKKTP
ncbi:MAG: FHA domain-containing protein [Candidatus Omnitrophota bacterium]|nr:FHA domain-containing protein [Candidatus Omnitrophota bacterium]MDZ4242070.1 FHA domain-containing protein [Candidatus Omnitrophota bacterium]